MSNSEKIQEIIETVSDAQYEEIRKQTMLNNRKRVAKERLSKFKTWFFDNLLAIIAIIIALLK